MYCYEKKITQNSCTIHNNVLSLTTKAKYLEVTITNNLNLNHHIDYVCKKTIPNTAFLQRNLPSCPRKTKELCYTMIRHQVDALVQCGTLYPDQQQQTGKCTALGCKIRAGRLPEQRSIYDPAAGMETTTTSRQAAKAV